MDKKMARPAEPLVKLPNGRLVWEDDLTLTLPEQVRLIAGYLAVGVVTVAIILFFSLPGK